MDRKLSFAGYDIQTRDPVPLNLHKSPKPSFR